jgi:hypothetical protein
MSKDPATPTTTKGRYIIVAELRSKPVGPFETALTGFGQTARLSQNVWLLRADGTTIGTVHNALVPQLGQRDSLFTAELGGGGRTTMFNCGPEIEARVRAMWKS